MKARDLMQKEIATLLPDMTLREMATFLDEEEIHGAPVVDGAGHLVGVASHTDLVRAISQAGQEPTTTTGGFFTFGSPRSGVRSESYVASSSVTDEMTVSDIMSRNLVTATEDATPAEIAELMLDEDVLRVIITRDDKLVGLISASDMLRVIIQKQS